MNAYFIPKNVVEAKRIATIRIRNLIDAAVCCLVFGKIVISIPFVTRVKIIVLVCVCIFLVLLNAIGIKDMSLSETLINYIFYRFNKAKFHLRSINYAKKTDGDTTALKNSVGGESIADKIYAYTKIKVAEIKNKFSGDNYEE